MRRDPTLSEEVQSYIQTLDWENEHGLTAEEKKNLEEGHKLVRGIVHYVLTSREEVAKYPFEQLTQKSFLLVSAPVGTNVPHDVLRRC
jgi:hypothetical protein